MARMMLVRIHWLQGRADDAVDLVGELQLLAARDIRFALANAYAWSICPLFLWCGDHERARRAIDDMHHHARQLDLPFTAAWACAFDLAWSRVTGIAPRLPDAPAAAAEACSKGIVAELLGTVDAAFVDRALLERLDQGTLGWCAPEIMRAHGERLLRDDGDGERARELFGQALALARAHGALAWELRAATSLASLAAREGRHHDAREVLEPVVARFKQGFATADMRRAEALLTQQVLH